MSQNDRFQPVFEQLKGILQSFSTHLTVEADGPESYYLNGPYAPQIKKEIFFGSVQVKKNYVSYYLMPVYIWPELLDGISPELKKRMQGKSCFNFTTVDQPRLEELAQLTARGFEQFQREYLQPA